MLGVILYDVMTTMTSCKHFQFFTIFTSPYLLVQTSISLFFHCYLISISVTIFIFVYLLIFIQIFLFIFQIVEVLNSHHDTLALLDAKSRQLQKEMIFLSRDLKMSPYPNWILIHKNIKCCMRLRIFKCVFFFCLWNI